MTQSKRIFYFDALRAMAIIGIVFCHASMPFILSGVNNSGFYISAFFDCFRDFSIPIFVMLSGALLIGKKDSFRDFFKKRLSRIFIPFLFWAAIYIVYSSIFLTHGFSLANAVDIFFGTAKTFGVTFWFIWMIIIAYIGIFIINKCMNHFSSDKFIPVLTLISLSYILICNFSLFDSYSSKIIYFVSFLSYVVIGYFIADASFLEDRFNPKTLVLITLILSVGSYLAYIFSFVVPKSLACGQFIALSYFKIPILFMSVMIFLLFKFMAKAGYFDKIEHGTLTLISSYSFGIYLAHYLVLHALKTNLLRFVDYLNQSPLIWIPLFVVLALAISLIILKVLDKIPYLKKVTGSN